MSDATTYRVDYLDGSTADVVVSYDPGVLLRAERQFKQPIGPMLMEGFLEPVYYAAWYWLRKTGRTPLDYEPWIDVVAKVEPVDEPKVSVGEVVEAVNPPESSSPPESFEPPPL